MTQTSTKKIVAGLLSLAMVLTAVVGVTSSASAQTTTAAASYSRNLTVGSRGTDVTSLQAMLQTGGFLSVAPTGYFGSLTKAALAAYQAANGISPAAGYFGPLTRAYVAAHGAGSVSTVPGCTAGAMYSSTTGQPCTTTTTTTVPGCTAGALYSSTTGQSCTTGGSTVTSTTEGLLTVTQSGSPSNNANVQTNSDVPVWGTDLRAQLGDVTVDRVDLQFSVTNNGSVENPGNFVNTIKVWNGSTVVKSWTVGTADFITGTSSNTYYVRLSGLGFVVPKDTTKTLTVSVSTNGGIDVDRVLTVSGYGSNSLQTSTGVNRIVSYYDVSGFSRQFTFKKPGTATLTIAADATNPFSQTYRVASTSNGAPNATLLAFSAKSDTGDSKITSVSVIATSSTTNGPTALYLYDGSTLLGSQSVATWSANTAQTVTFNNLTYVVPKDVTKTLTVTGDFPTATNASIASTTVSSVIYQKPNGTSATLTPNVAGNNQYFYQVSPQYSLISAGTPTTLTTGTNGTFNGLSNTFQIKAKPVGGSMLPPTTGNFAATVTVGGTSYSATISDVSVVGNPTVLSEGSEYTINVTATIASTTLPTGVGTARFNLTSATAVVNGQTIAQTWGLNNFQSAPVTYSK